MHRQICRQGQRGTAGRFQRKDGDRALLMPRGATGSQGQTAGTLVCFAAAGLSLRAKVLSSNAHTSPPPHPNSSISTGKAQGPGYRLDIF